MSSDESAETPMRAMVFRVAVAAMAAGILSGRAPAALDHHAARAATGATPMIADRTGTTPAASPVLPLAASDKAHEPVVLGAAPTYVTLAPSAANGGAADASLASRLRRALRDGRRFYLVLGGVRVQAHPQAVYNVFLNLPQGASAAGAGDPHFAGVLGFFNVPPGVRRDIPLAATPVVETLSAKGELGERLTVTFVPVPLGEASGEARPEIGRIELVASE